MKLNVVVLLLLLLFTTTTCCPSSDRRALLAFRSALHEPYLGIFNSWTGQDCCHNWYGVSCDLITHRVAALNLRGESEDPIFERAHRIGFMTGCISPAICDLPRLSAITIADWKGISGDIPKCITRLPSLNLRNNLISGLIPPDFGRLTMLSRALLSGNRITGRIPESLTRIYRLADLDLSGKQLYGTIPPV
ncbi:unnamed protein product [Arabis nemorensis]|uniref:Leucine-rich repeat-containing N-terminal plant-type domain-containing protein n=1 Tax=Arabis nemorensis TaxID=586526 RepID=A0A565BC99_9BRAS|nr:unnamed protein product [Arabis nemorensis]